MVVGNSVMSSDVIKTFFQDQDQDLNFDAGTAVTDGICGGRLKFRSLASFFTAKLFAVREGICMDFCAMWD